MIPRFVESNCGGQPCCSSIVLFIPHGQRPQRWVIIGCAVISAQKVDMGIRRPGFLAHHLKICAMLKKKKAVREARKHIQRAESVRPTSTDKLTQLLGNLIVH